jgi:hypothetical protein
VDTQWGRFVAAIHMPCISGQRTSEILVISMAAIALAIMPAHSRSPTLLERSAVKVAEQPPARPGGAIPGSCYVQGRWYPNGARVPLDPGPLSAMAAPVYVRCTQGMLCYYSAPSVCIRPGLLAR